MENFAWNSLGWQASPVILSEVAAPFSSDHFRSARPRSRRIPLGFDQRAHRSSIPGL